MNKGYYKDPKTGDIKPGDFEEAWKKYIDNIKDTISYDDDGDPLEEAWSKFMTSKVYDADEAQLDDEDEIFISYDDDGVPLEEAKKYDILAVIKTIQSFNKGTASDLPNEIYLARQILRDLGYRVTTKNVKTVVDHLITSSDDEKIPADISIVKELISMLETFK